MRPLRLAILALIGFFSAFLGNFFAPGAWGQRVVAAALCGVLSYDSAACQVNLPLLSNQAVALDRSSVLLANRANEFDDPSPSVPAPNPQAPAFPHEVSPNLPLRPDFQDGNESQRSLVPGNTAPNLEGIWLYVLSQQPDFGGEKAYLPLKASKAGQEFDIQECFADCYSIIRNFTPRYSNKPFHHALAVSFDNGDKFEAIPNEDFEFFWGVAELAEPSAEISSPFYFAVARISNSATKLLG